MAEGRSAYAAIGQRIADGFDAEYYLWHNPDVAAAGVDPLLHYNVVGWREGRDPNAWFDTDGYLSYYTDVAAAGINPLHHYESVGWREGRDPSTAFAHAAIWRGIRTSRRPASIRSTTSCNSASMRAGTRRVTGCDTDAGGGAAGQAAPIGLPLSPAATTSDNRETHCALPSSPGADPRLSHCNTPPSHGRTDHHQLGARAVMSEGLRAL